MPQSVLREIQSAPEADAQVESAAAYITIRGTRLSLDALTAPKLHDAQYLDSLRAELGCAQPFAHVVVQDWFSPVLLRLVQDEFAQLPRSQWNTATNHHARVERSNLDASLGPASQLYFSVLNSRFFVGLLSYITGVSDLLPDPTLVGGGLHETLAGGRFGIHTDFDRHPQTALHNEMVFITYLNAGWQSEWGGALELWDAKQRQCCAKVEPEFGRSIIMLHGKTHFHGHSEPLAPPQGVTRKSLAAYFYSNRYAREDRGEPMVSHFMFATRTERIKASLKKWLPPVLTAQIQRRRANRAKQASLVE
jgi:Rps23 Pro-64 3,4-dihydroxylase Tpa1-like proline 4-hydroxylase